MFSWLGLLKGLLSLANGLTTFLNNKQLMDAGEAKATAKALQQSMERVDQARKIRDRRGSFEDDLSEM